MLPPVRPMRASMSGGPSTSWCSRQSSKSGAKRAIRSMNWRADLVAPVRPSRSRRARTGRTRSAGACRAARASGRGPSARRSRRSRRPARRAAQDSKASWAASRPVVTSTRPAGGEVLAGRGGPGREAAERGVELHDRAADLPRLEAVLEGGGDVVVAEQAQRDLGVGVADDGGGADQRPVLEPARPRRARSRRRARRWRAWRRPPARRRRSRTRSSPCRRARSPTAGRGPRGRPGSA